MWSFTVNEKGDLVIFTQLFSCRAYPYIGKDEKTCNFTSNGVGATEKSYVRIRSLSEKDLEKAVAFVGPVSVAIDASQLSFLLYGEGKNTFLCSFHS